MPECQGERFQKPLKIKLATLPKEWLSNCQLWDNDRAGPSKCWGNTWDLETDTKLWVKLKAFLETERHPLLRTCLKCCTSACEAGTKHRESKGLVGHARRPQWQSASRSAQSAGLGDTAPGEKTGSGSFYNLQAKHENAFSTHSNGKDQSWQCSSKSLGDGRWVEVGEAEERTGPLFHWGKNATPSKALGIRYRGSRTAYCLMPHRYSRKRYKSNRIIIKRRGRRHEG